MILLLDVLIIFLLFLLFGVSHSILASKKFKEKLANRIGNKIAFFRLFYNVSSIIILIAIYVIAPKPSTIIYELEYPFDIIIFIFQVLSLIGFLWSSKYMDAKEFLGINQAVRYFNGTYNVQELDEHSEFVSNGPYKISRHPIYFFSILFLAFRPIMDVFYLTTFCCLIIYFYIGSKYEEDKLVQKFGQKYLDYQKVTPRIFPSIFKRKIINK